MRLPSNAGTVAEKATTKTPATKNRLMRQKPLRQRGGKEVKGRLPKRTPVLTVARKATWPKIATALEGGLLARGPGKKGEREREKKGEKGKEGETEEKREGEMKRRMMQRRSRSY